MAYHSIIFPRLVDAIRGEKVAPLPYATGSVNYRLMTAVQAWIIEPGEAEEFRLRDLFTEMRMVGHLSLEGPKGVACEQGAPAMHWTFNVGPVAGLLKWARDRGNDRLVELALAFLKDEAGLDLAHTYNGRCIMPAPRVKDEKGQGPLDGYRDTFVAMVQGRRVKKGADYWSDPQAIAVTTLREVDRDTKGELFRTLRQARMPRLYLPIKREIDLGIGFDGWREFSSTPPFHAWIERTPEAEKAMGRDGCNWVCAWPAGFKWGYDWEREPWGAGEVV